MHKSIKLASVLLFSAFITGAPALSQADTPLTTDQKEAVQALIKETLINNPEIVMEAIRNFQQQQAEAENKARKMALAHSTDALLNDPSSPVLGNPAGDVTLVEFFDYRCGYCKRVFPSVMKLLKDDGNIRYVVKEFPILGRDSEFASRAALAAVPQGKYTELHMALMGTQGGLSEAKVLNVAKSVGLDIEKLKADMNSDEINEALKRNYGLAQSLGITGTPAFVIGEELAPGAIDIDQMRALVKAARENQKNKKG